MIIQPGSLRFQGSSPSPGPNPTPLPPTIYKTPVPVIISSGGYGSTVIKDGNYLIQSPYTTRYDTQITVPNYAPTFTSLSPEKATVSQEGYVTTREEGLVTIKVTVNEQVFEVIHNGRFVTSPVPTPVFQSYVEGSLGDNIFSGINSLVTSGRTELNIYDENCWANLDWSGVSSSNSQNNHRRGATAISPLHVLMATHYRISNNQTITIDGETRTVVNQGGIPNSDISIGLLDSPVSKFYKVLPSNWFNYLTIHRLPMVVCTDQQRHAILRDANAMSPTLVHFQSDVFSEAIVSGDSGQPLFTIINGELVLLGSHWTSASCTHISYYINEINNVMNFLGGGYQLTTIDLSGFPNYV